MSTYRPKSVSGVSFEGETYMEMSSYGVLYSVFWAVYFCCDAGFCTEAVSFLTLRLARDHKYFSMFLFNFLFMKFYEI